MTVDRRSVLKGMTVGSLAGPFIGGSLPALASVIAAPARNAARPTLALVTLGAADSAFVYGARAAIGSPLQVHETGGDVGAMLDFERRLRCGEPLHVIGLLDDASATLVVDLARGAGANVHWLGQHTVKAGLSRHRLLNTDVAEGCVSQLSRQLQACGAGFTLSEERQNSAIAARRLAGPARSGAHSDQWAAGIGYLLASLGTRALAMAPLVPASGAPLTGSFVSFSIEV